MRFRAVAVGLFGVGALYRRRARRRVLTWGATEAEASSRLQGDELLERADGMSTRAISIDAPKSAVWPWLVQMGPLPRGGAYTYDWIENLLRLNMHSVARVLPEFQDPQVGDSISFGSNKMRLARIEPEAALVWRSEDGSWVWAFVLRERDGGTRLISRNRFRLQSRSARLGMIFMEAGSLLMERKMLRGIRERAERLAEVSVAEGEVFGLLGPNGAGKTTTIRLLLDLIRPSDGSVRVFGVDHRAGAAVRRRIGYLPGDLRLYERLSGRALLTYFAGLRGLDGLGRAIDLADRLGITLDRPLKTLSKGNRQKVGIVQVFMHDPELLILDEPTSGLDPLVQQCVYDLLEEARAAGRTVLLSSHVLPEVQRVADRVALLRSSCFRSFSPD